MAQSISVWVTVVSGLLALGGIGAKGVADIILERAKLDSQLILEALRSPNIESRRSSLQLLVETGLVANDQTVEGLRKYFEGSLQMNPPQFIPANSRGVAESVAGHATKTDIDLYICEEQFKNTRALRLTDSARQAIEASKNFGRVRKRVWEGSLLEEIDSDALRGKTTIIIDASHGEAGELQPLKNLLAPILELSPIEVVGNRGGPTEWLISLVLCPAEL